MAFWRNYVHLVWTTKNRQSFIHETIESQLYAYIVSRCAEMECHVYAINGTGDHLHLVLAIPPKHGIAEVVKMLKGASSHFVNQVLSPVEFNFQWQRGYGCFSLGHTQLARAVEYVEAQKEHHARQTTNAWLERTSEEYEGPAEAFATPQAMNILREARVAYDVLGEMPF
jgi:REP element-mobilizing transposase RayT